MRPAFGPFIDAVPDVAPYAVPVLNARNARLPQTPTPYHQLLRGPTRRWWRPLVTLLAFAGLYIGFVIVAEVIATVFKALRGEDLLVDPTLNLGSASSFLEVNLTLIAMLPAATLSIWAVHRIRPGFVSSVVGRFRWRWLVRSLLIIVPIWIGYVGLGVAVGLATGSPITARPADWLTLLILVLLTTPFQAAAEEYVFRGWLTQNLGSYFGSERTSWVVTAVVAAGLFALAHGTADVWIIADLVAFSFAASLLAWRTGGLESGIALHAVNNMLTFGTVLAVGGWEEAFIDSASAGSPVNLAISLVFDALVVVLVWRLAGRRRLVRTYPAL